MVNLTHVAEIKEWAYANYNEQFGASCIVECLSDEDIQEMFTCLRDAQDWADMQSEQYRNAWCDAY